MSNSNKPIPQIASSVSSVEQEDDISSVVCQVSQNIQNLDQRRCSEKNFKVFSSRIKKDTANLSQEGDRSNDAPKPLKEGISNLKSTT
jgi:hypothetical protein